MEKPSLPRVTEILHLFTPYTHVPTDVLENAATRGSKVHGLCALVAKDLWIPPYAEELEPYVNSFTRWHNSNVKRLDMVEKRLTDKEQSYTGQIDFVFQLIDNQTWLVDLKTCYAPQKSHPVQMAAYRNMLRDNGIDVVGAKLVYAQRTGKDAKILSYTNAQLDEMAEIFNAALKCYYYFKHKGKKK